MRIYLDTGVFIDYLSRHGQQNAVLRTVGRRERSASDLALDAEKLFETIQRCHTGATSCLTFYEGEEALYGKLSRALAVKDVPHADKLLIPAVRYYPEQIQIVIRTFGFEVCDMTAATVKVQLQENQLRTGGIRAADALHIATAIEFRADSFVTTDENLLALDQRVCNLSGDPIRFVDSDQALQLL